MEDCGIKWWFLEQQQPVQPEQQQRFPPCSLQLYKKQAQENFRNHRIIFRTGLSCKVRFFRAMKMFLPVLCFCSTQVALL